MKKIYGIGTGPGDPELLTLKAVRVLEEASVIFAPHNRGKNMAIDTVEKFIDIEKVKYIDFPMGSVTREDYIDAAKMMTNDIPEGKSGVYLTIGDPLIYSTFTYIMQELEEDVEVEIVPGIPSFVAAASVIKEPLTVKGDTFIVCDEFQEAFLDKTNSIAILKTFKEKENILNSLDKKGFTYKYIKRATLDGEEVLDNKEDILNDKNYISLILARKNK